MTDTMTRRSILKYAVAMGAALALPAGSAALAVDDDTLTPSVVKELDDKALPMGNTPVNDAQGRELALETCRKEMLYRECEMVLTRMLRHEMVAAFEHAPAERWNRHLATPAARVRTQQVFYGFFVDRDGLDSEDDAIVADTLAQVMVWAVESGLSGYGPEQCRIAFVDIDGVPEVSLIVSMEGFAA